MEIYNPATLQPYNPTTPTLTPRAQVQVQVRGEGEGEGEGDSGRSEEALT